MRGKKKNKRTDKTGELPELLEQDEHFYFIAGYTEGGFPYGITWEEYEAQQRGGSLMEEREGRSVKKLKLSESQLQEITDTFDMNVEGTESFLNIETGKVVTSHTIDREEEDEELSDIIE